MKKIMILSTQRSGSSMVCDDFAGTSKLGRPSEYFINVINVYTFKKEEELKSLVFSVLDKGISGGVMSIKVMSNQIGVIGLILKKAGLCNSSDNAECFYQYFKDWFFVRVFREDKVAQAVSRVMAQQSRIYHYINDVTGLEGMYGRASCFPRDESLLHYDCDAISKSIDDIKRQELFIDNFLNKFSIFSFAVSYEEAVRDRSYVYKIAHELGVGEVALSNRRFNKISLNSESWINKFKQSVKNF